MPIDGKLVIKREVEKEQLYALWDRLMGRKKRLTKQKRGFSLKSLEEILNKFEQDDDATVRAPVLYLIQLEIVPSFNNIVPLVYLNFLEEVGKIKDLKGHFYFFSVRI